jgi:hypothetical protein
MVAGLSLPRSAPASGRAFDTSRCQQDEGTMPTEDVFEESGRQSGELREQLNRIGADRVVAPRRGDDPPGAGQAARRAWPGLPLPEPVARAEPAFDAPFHAGAEDAAGPLHA